MKKSILIPAIVALTFLFSTSGIQTSQGQTTAPAKPKTTGTTKNAGSTAKPAAAKPATWKEQADFHEVMAATFHPAEKGDLQPIKSRIAEMSRKAELWANSTPPKGVATAPD